MQLALFFVSASFLAMGIFLAPMIAGASRGTRTKLAIVLFGAVVLVVVGSLLGEAAELQGRHQAAPARGSGWARRAGSTSTWAGSGRSC